MFYNSIFPTANTGLQLLTIQNGEEHSQFDRTRILNRVGAENTCPSNSCKYKHKYEEKHKESKKYSDQVSIVHEKIMAARNIVHVDVQNTVLGIGGT